MTRRWDAYVSGVFVEYEKFPVEATEPEVIDYFVIDCGYPRAELAVVMSGRGR